MAAGQRLDELGELRSLSALNEKVALLRLVGRLDEAWDIANEAVRQARFTGDREMLLAARIRRAQVQQFLGRLDDAMTELSLCMEEARVHEWTRLESYATQQRGKVNFDQGMLSAARADFAAAIALGERLGASQEEMESALMALEVVDAHRSVEG